MGDLSKVRTNMRERLLAYTDKPLLRKRAIIESVNCVAYSPNLR